MILHRACVSPAHTCRLRLLHFHHKMKYLFRGGGIFLSSGISLWSEWMQLIWYTRLPPVPQVTGSLVLIRGERTQLWVKICDFGKSLHGSQPMVFF